jgi:signal transduction histidine kinase
MLLFTLLVTGIILLLALSVYYFSGLERKVVFNRRLKGRANFTAQVYSLFGDSSSAMLSRVDSTIAIGLLRQRSIIIYSPRGHELYQFQPEDWRPLIVDQTVFDEMNAKDETYFNVGQREAIALKHADTDSAFIVVVAAYDEDGLARMADLLKILLISLVAAILLTAWIGFLFSKKLLAPISQIIYEVNDISSHNLSHRLQPGNGRDELSQLSNTFNELLERLQKSFGIQKRFISNASHELSTPLTSISSQLEVTLQKERNNAEYQRVLLSINEDVVEMRQLTKSLLEIAKADVLGNIELSDVRIDEILLRLNSEIELIDTAYRVELNFGEFPDDEKECVVFGNVELLHSAIKNIVENGCKYSSDKYARIDLSYFNQQIHIKIANAGNGISTEELQKIFQPFYRGSNAKEYKGSGLGLALAKGIIGIHKGTINVNSRLSEGTTFEIMIPSIKSMQAEVDLSAF